MLSQMCLWIPYARNIDKSSHNIDKMAGMIGDTSVILNPARPPGNHGRADSPFVAVVLVIAKRCIAGICPVFS